MSNVFSLLSCMPDTFFSTFGINDHGGVATSNNNVLVVYKSYFKHYFKG